LESTDKSINLGSGLNHRTIIKDRMVQFEKRDCVEGGINSLISENHEIKENDNKFICIKDCIYRKGTIVEVVDRLKEYIIVSDNKNKNVFTYKEFKEYFTEYIDINKYEFKEASGINK
jgi:hypothetical protein